MAVDTEVLFTVYILTPCRTLFSGAEQETGSYLKKETKRYFLLHANSFMYNRESSIKVYAMFFYAAANAG